MNPVLYNDLIKLRHELHKHPELSGNEYETQKRLKEYLRSCYPDNLWEVGGTGLLACFDSGQEGPHIMLRADIDALPIEEQNDDLNHRSAFSGISHKCGHDGHSAILCGVAKQLHKKPIQKGKAFLLFQPAEETGQGAKAVLSDPIFQDHHNHIDYAFALHNLPSYPVHSIVMRHQNFTASVKSLSAKLEGVTAHAAEPESGVSPALAVAQIIQQFKHWEISDFTREDFQLLTPIQVMMGEEAYGTAAGAAVLRYTLRAWNNPRLQALQEQIESLLAETAKETGLTISWEWIEEFHSNRNNKAAVEAIEEVTSQLGLQQVWRDYPFKWGEDFGLFTQHIPGAMFGLGIGEGVPALHRPDYDFLDEVIPTGMAVFEQLLRKWCGTK